MKDFPDKNFQREKLYGLLGDLPERNRVISSRKISEEERDNYILEKLILDLNGYESVPAYFVRPKNLNGKIPTILYNHAHFGEYDLGKNEFLYGRKEIQIPPYAAEFTRNGWAGLCIDAWAFGERSGRTETEIFKYMLWHGQVMWGMMVYDGLRTLDYLISRPDVDGDRIGVMGMSMGCTLSWWLTALDTRIKVCVGLLCLTDYQSLIESRGLDCHNIYYYVPGLLKHFTSAQINSLISPRPYLSINGNFDLLTPAKGLDIIDAGLKEVYYKEGAPNAWKLIRYNTGHFETADMRNEIISFLRRWL